MKKSNVCMIAVVAGLLPAVSFAEGDGKEDWAEKAAVQYEDKAVKAAADGNVDDAAIYMKMAQIKRDAGAAAKAGKEFSWDEYHALSGQLGGGKKDKGKDTNWKDKGDKGKDTNWKNKGDKGKDVNWKDKKGGDPSKYSKTEHKEKFHDKKAHVDKKGKENAGDGFIKTAQEYQQKGIEAMNSGDTEKASIYMELAKMKLDAATAVGQGKGYDWTKYHELTKKLGK